MLRSTIHHVAAMALIAALGEPGAAQANLVGDLIDIDLDFTDPLQTDQQREDEEVVTPDRELRAGFSDPDFFVFGRVDVNVEDTEIMLEVAAGSGNLMDAPPFLAAFSLALTDLDWVGEAGFIVEVIPDPGNDPGFTVASFGPGEIEIDYAGLPATGASFLQANARFDIVTIPEPSTLLMLAAGLGGLALTQRRSGPPTRPPSR